MHALPGILDGQHLIETVGFIGLLLVVFAETGLLLGFFLPGDSLLFAAGALAATIDPATGSRLLRVELVTALLLVAAILGDAVNYAVGHYIGPRIFTATDTTGLLHRVLNRNHLAQAHAFFEKYGGKAVVLGRWVPIVRTFVPFVAGAGSMTYRTFFVYNVVGAVIWVGVCIGAGYLFGNIPVVQKNFSLVMLGIVAVSLIPAAIEFLKHRRGQP